METKDLTPDEHERKLTLQMARSLIVAKNAEHPTHNLIRAIEALDKEIKSTPPK